MGTGPGLFAHDVDDDAGMDPRDVPALRFHMFPLVFGLEELYYEFPHQLLCCEAS